MSNWTGRVCVITGAGSGIGAGLARQALSRGMQVICADIDAAGLQHSTARAGLTPSLRESEGNYGLPRLHPPVPVPFK